MSLIPSADFPTTEVMEAGIIVEGISKTYAADAKDITTGVVIIGADVGDVEDSLAEWIAEKALRTIEGGEGTEIIDLRPAKAIPEEKESEELREDPAGDEPSQRRELPPRRSGDEDARKRRRSARRRMRMSLTLGRRAMRRMRTLARSWSRDATGGLQAKANSAEELLNPPKRGELHD